MKSFDKMTKLELEAYGREHLDIELDRRKSKGSLVKQIKEAVAAKEAAEEAAEEAVEEVVEEVAVEVEAPKPEPKVWDVIEEEEVVEEVDASVAIEAFDAWVASGRNRLTFAALKEAVVGSPIEKAFKGWNVDRRSPNYRALVRKIDSLR